MFRTFHQLLDEFERDTPGLREGLQRAIEWRTRYEGEATRRDDDDRRRSVSTALDRAFAVLLHETVDYWAPADDGFNADALNQALASLDTRLQAELASLDKEFDAALQLGLRYASEVCLYHSSTGAWLTYQRQPDSGGRFLPWTAERFRERFFAEDYSYEEVAFAGRVENQTKGVFDRSAGVPGFVANVIAQFHAEPQRNVDILDHSPDVIATMYSKSFADEEHAKDRLKIVVGLNALNTPDLNSVRTVLIREVARAGKVMETLPCNAVVVGVLWSPEWFDNERNEFVTADDVRHAYSLLSGDKTGAVGWTKFPFAGMRNFLKNHRFAAQFANQLKAAGLRPFMHLGDGDAVSLAAPRPLPSHWVLPTPLKADGLLDRFDEIWMNIPADQRARIARVSGGFALRPAHLRGDLDPMEATTDATVYANELDMAVRAVLGEAAYFPEPNTFIDMAVAEQFDLDQDQLTDPEPDLGPLLGRLVRDAGYRSLYDQRLSLVTSGRNAKVNVTRSGIQQMADWVTQKNHAASFTAWTYRVAEYHGLAKDTVARVLKRHLDNEEKGLLGMVWGTHWSVLRALEEELDPQVIADIVAKARATVAVFRVAGTFLKG